MRTLVSRIIAGPIAALVMWLIGMGIEVGTGFETALNEAATLLVIAVGGSLYGVAHKLLDKRINPLDAAKSPENLARTPRPSE